MNLSRSDSVPFRESDSFGAMSSSMTHPPDIQICLDLHDTTVTIQTMTPGDREIESEFVRNLSDKSRYYRFHSALRELTPELLERSPISSKTRGPKGIGDE